MAEMNVPAGGGHKKGAKKVRGKKRDRDRMVEEYLPLVRHVASRIGANLPSHVDHEELFQVGSVGLVNARDVPKGCGQGPGEFAISQTIFW